MLLLNRLMNKFILFLVLFVVLNLSLMKVSYSQDLLRAELEVIWEGGPDLVVPFFIPPLIESAPGKTVYIRFIVANNGNTQSIESMIRFYISTNEIIDPAVDQSIGSARVPALNVDELTVERMLQFTIPNDFLPGRYYLAACADADNEVPELNENNNCSFSKLDNYVSVVVPNIKIPNTPPVCGLAFPSNAKLWPPNHKLINILVSGVTDIDGDPITIIINSILQDEPVNGLGDGDTSPDGFGIGTSIARIRSERAGEGNGRVYMINFTASDDKGASCKGVVFVGVPHDKSSQNIVDDGGRFDSTSAFTSSENTDNESPHDKESSSKS